MAVGGIKSLFSPAKEEPLTDTDSPAGGSIELSEEEAGKLQSLRQSVLADVDKKTAITTLTVTLQDPKVTATVADSVVSKLQQYIIAYRTRKAKEDCRYLEQLYRSVRRNITKPSSGMRNMWMPTATWCSRVPWPSANGFRTICRWPIRSTAR